MNCGSFWLMRKSGLLKYYRILHTSFSVKFCQVVASLFRSLGTIQMALTYFWIILAEIQTKMCSNINNYYKYYYFYYYHNYYYSLHSLIDYGLDGPGSNPGGDETFRPASCKMGTGSFPGVTWGRGVLLTTHPLLVSRSWKSRAIPLPTLWTTPGL
jgi:hypothetical protein